MKVTTAALIGVLLAGTLSQGQQKEASWKPVETAMGRSGAPQPDGACKFSMPRSDLRVVASGISLKPGFALGSWAAFDRPGPGATAMGDLVLLEDEVNPVIARLQQAGIEITAVHNHLLHESPRIIYVHFHGHGDAQRIAQGLHQALAATATPPAAPPPSQPPALGFDSATVEQALGYKGKNNGGVFQVAVPRAEPIVSGGPLLNSMGVATAINFQSTGGGKAAITGDFVLIGSEVNPVIAAVRQAGIAITALHSHMLDEQPRLFFMHFWANDDPVKLARGLRAALEKMNVQKPH